MQDTSRTGLRGQCIALLIATYPVYCAYTISKRLSRGQIGTRHRFRRLHAAIGTSTIYFVMIAPSLWYALTETHLDCAREHSYLALVSMFFVYSVLIFGNNLLFSHARCLRAVRTLHRTSLGSFRTAVIAYATFTVTAIAILATTASALGEAARG
jgi:hypothetical protein